ncbi:hypothetical protein [Nocardia salmonicida]|uniref:hypothetical protein n=1 Tax=Nocardia salmonicida TaxID=53431 RepID=UPI0033ECE552
MSAFSGSGWSMDLDDSGANGMVLHNVTHDGFSMASDIRITRLAIASQPPGRVGPDDLFDYVLGSAVMPAATPVTFPGGYHRAFPYYQTPTGMSRDYVAKKPWLDGEPNVCTLGLRQQYLFTDYGKDPPHEPGGVLDAARIFPLLTFWLPPVSDRRSRYPRYLRVDFRIDVAIDNIDEMTLATGRKPGGIQRNRAGMFRDSDKDPNLAAVGLRAAGQFLFPDAQVSPLRSIFAAVEKPLRYEVATGGLIDGVRPPGWDPKDTWDNLHFWAANRGYISTPGAFHALHCHWRWGAPAGIKQSGVFFDGPLRAAGQKQFGLGTPLVDPMLPRQNMWFAVTNRDVFDIPHGGGGPAADKPFVDAFRRVQGVPSAMSKTGDDLVLWISFEAFREESAYWLSRPWTGTFFVNGMYFAHNPDRTPQALQFGGVNHDDAMPPAQPNWVRKAR